jgi:hypothetical protein
LNTLRNCCRFRKCSCGLNVYAHMGFKGASPIMARLSGAQYLAAFSAAPF